MNRISQGQRKLGALWGALAAVAQTRDGNTVTLNPWGFHSANIVLHALSSFVVFTILRKLVASDWPALAGAMLFASSGVAKSRPSRTATARAARNSATVARGEAPSASIRSSRVDRVMSAM